MPRTPSAARPRRASSTRGGRRRLLTALASLASVSAAMAATTSGTATAAPALAGTRLHAPSAAHAASTAGTDTAPVANASALAAKTGKPVEVASLASGTRQVMANPDGTFTATMNTVPVRAKKAGTWKPIDTALAANADGTLSPKVSALSVAFSPGGTGPAVSIAAPDATESVALYWPDPLPTPQVSGNAALYPNVLPGVDLRLAAEADTYREILIVHDAAAAANPKLAKLRLHVRAEGLRVKDDGDGHLTATDASGATVLHAPRPVMWDSHVDKHLGSTPTADDTGSGTVTTVGVSVAPVAMARGGADARQDSDADLTLTPPAAALTGKGVAYPLYIDPGLSAGLQHWLEVNSVGDPFYDPNDVVRVGYCGWSGCLSGAVYRSYFQMDTSVLSQGNGTHARVDSAIFSVTETWGAAPQGVKEPVDLYTSSDFGSGTKWSSQPNTGLIVEQTSAGGNSSADAAAVKFDTTAYLQQTAANFWAHTNFMLRAPAEGDLNQWKKFDHNASLSVTYDFPPNPPTGLAVSHAITCNGTTYTPDAAPTLMATATDNNPQPLPIGYGFELYKGGDDNATARLAANYPGTEVLAGSGAVAGWTENYSSDLGIGDWQFRVADYNKPYDTSPSWSGVWGGWYRFTSMHEDLTGVTPAISSFDFPQDASGNAQWGAPSGSGQLYLGNGDNGTNHGSNVAGFSYAFDNGGALNAIPLTDCGTPTPLGMSGIVQATYNSSVSYGGTGGAVLPLPAGLAPGHHRLYVRGFDVVHNPTGTATFDFLVSPNNGTSALAHLPMTGAISDPFLGLCLDDLANSSTAGTKVEIFGCNHWPHQIWTLSGNGTITHNGLCVDITGGPSAAVSGAPVELWACNGQTNQQWQPRQDANGNWTLVNPASGLCLDDPGWSRTLGMQMQVWSCNNSTAQTWRFDLDPYRYGAQDAGVTVSGTAPNTTLTTQNTVTGVTFSGDNQVSWFAPSVGATMTIPFTTAAEADYSLGIRLTKAPTGGQVSFTLDGATKLSPAALSATGGVFDGYSAACCSAQYIPLGGQHLAAGGHTLTLTVTGKNSGDTAADPYGVGVDYVEAAPYDAATVDGFAHSLNNGGISDDASPAAADLDLASPPQPGDLGGSGSGHSLSRQTLAAASLAPGTAFTLSGVNFTMPRAGTAGFDNTIAMGQTVTLDAAQQIRANGVGLLVAAVNGGTPRTTATISYGGGQAPDVVDVPAVGDWCAGPAAAAAFVLPYRNSPAGKDTSCPVKLYLIVLPAHPINNLVSVTLPYLGTGLTPGSHDPALHVLALGVRPAATANLATSADASGAGHRLTLAGRVGFDNAGKGGAAVFDGSGSGAATAGPVLDTTKPFSVSAWVDGQNLTGGPQTMVTQQAAAGSGFALEYNGRTWDFARSATDSANPVTPAATAGAAATAGWHHLVGTWDGTTMVLYVDGVAQAATAVDSTPIASAGPLVIGRGFAGGAATKPFTGEIADVQVYQQALKASDVLTLYNGDVHSSLAGPAGWWQLADFGRNWTGVWAAQPDGPSQASTPALSGTTLRQVVHPGNLGYGTVKTLINCVYGAASAPVQTRVRLTNRFGSAPVTVTAATLAAQATAGGSATVGAPAALAFNGSASVTINPGAEVVSDPVALPATGSGSGDLVVSLALGSGTGTAPISNQLTGPAYPVFVAAGDQTRDATGAPTLWSTNPALTGRYWLSGLDVTDVDDPIANPGAATQPGTVAVLGDQVSGAGTPRTWVDLVGSDPAVFNPAFDPVNGPGPNPGGFADLSNGGASVADAVTRFASAPNETVLDEPNLKAVVVTLGLNDLKNGATAAAIEGDLKTLVTSVTPYGITNHYNPDGTRKVDVYLATVPDAPGLTSTQEEQRNLLNTCIASSGESPSCDPTAAQGLFGGTSNTGGAIGFVDIDKAVAGAGASATQAQINAAILAAVKADTSMTGTW